MPKDTSPPAFLFYPDDFSSDGVVEAMTTEEVGAYILLLCKAWREDPPGSIPDNDSVLARWARLTSDRWSGCRTGVLAAFTLGANGRWQQKRMRLEHGKLSKGMKIRSEAAKKGADSKWQAYRNRIATASENDSAPIGNEDGIESSLNSGEVQKGDFPALPPSLNSPEVRAAWADFVEHRQQIRKPLTPMAVQERFAELSKWGPVRAVAALRHSIANGWVGVFEPKSNQPAVEVKQSSAERMAQNYKKGRSQ